MGQKSIPKSLRLNNFKNWESSWIAEKKEYSNYLNIDLNIRKYFEVICNNDKTNLSHINIKKKNDFFLVYVYLHNQDKKKNILNFQKTKIEQNINNFLELYNIDRKYKSKVFIVNLTMKSFKKGYDFYKITKYYRKHKLKKNLSNFLGIMNTIIYNKRVELLNNFLCKNLEKTPKHKQYLKNLNKILSKLYIKYPNFLGYKIQFKGRVNGIERSRKFVIQEGKIPLNTLKYDIKYNYKKVLTPYGICSLKTWLFFKEDTQ